MYYFEEYKHIVETNIKCYEEGKPPKYIAPSIGGDKLLKALTENIK